MKHRRSGCAGRALRKRGVLALALALAGLSPAAQAQVQRTFVNLGFETPDLGTNACVGNFVGPQQVTGWNTTHSSRTAGGCGVTPNPATGPILELWANGGASAVPARAGKQFAELNAAEASRVYQNICFTNGEVINWRLSHRGRNSATTPDVMDFGLNASGSTSAAITSVVARIGTTNNGTDRVNTTGTPSSASQGTLTIGTSVNGWRDYSGSFTYTGASGVQQVGFAAVSSSGGISLGNFLDEIQVTLTPYLEFSSANFSVREGQTTGLPQMRVIGTVPAGGIVVPIQITGGTATVGSDYSVDNGTNTTVNLSIPAGTYDNQLFTLPITVIDDTVIENNETVTFTAQANPSSYTLTSTSACVTAGQSQATLTILDNDVDLLTTKTVSNAAPTPGGTTQYTVRYANNTAQPTVGDTTAHDAVVTLSDPVPAGLTFTSWTCVGNGATCPAASGSGAITGTATLPAGSAGAAGASLTYTITATLGAGQCSAINNVSSIATVSPFAEGTSAQSGFVTPTPGGSANNSATVAIDAVCSGLSLTKSDGETTYTPGGTATYVLTACNSDDPDSDTANGATVNDTLPDGVTLRGPWTCAGSGAIPGTCPASGGAVGDSTIAVASINLPPGGCVAVSLPVSFSADPDDY